MGLKYVSVFMNQSKLTGDSTHTWRQTVASRLRMAAVDIESSQALVPSNPAPAAGYFVLLPGSPIPEFSHVFPLIPLRYPASSVGCLHLYLDFKRGLICLHREGIFGQHESQKSDYTS